MNEQSCIDEALSYLKPIKFIELQIQSTKRELKRLNSDITTIGAVDYSKDRISGGEVKGLADSVAKLVDTERRCRERIKVLIDKREEARRYIDALTCEIGRVLLKEEYINGMSAKGAMAFSGYGKSQGQGHKRTALIELGYNLQKHRTISD